MKKNFINLISYWSTYPIEYLMVFLDVRRMSNKRREMMYQTAIIAQSNLKLIEERYFAEHNVKTYLKIIKYHKDREGQAKNIFDRIYLWWLKLSREYLQYKCNILKERKILIKSKYEYIQFKKDLKEDQDIMLSALDYVQDGVKKFRKANKNMCDEHDNEF